MRWRPTPTRFLILIAGFLVIAGGCGGGAGPTAPEPVDGGASPPAATAGPAGGGSQPGGGSDPGGSPQPGSGGDDPAPTGRGTLRLWLTDAPVDEVSELQVFIAEIKLKRSGSPVERFPSSIGLVDLLALQGGVTALLGQDLVEAGTYQFIELLLDESQSYVVELDSGETRPLKIPSRKIKIAGGPFEVAADGSTSVVVDFDAEKSLKKTGNGRYQLKPFVTIVEVSPS